MHTSTFIQAPISRGTLVEWGLVAFLARRCALLVACAVVSIAPGCRWVSHGQNADGVSMFQHGYYQNAIRKFQQAIANDPNNPDGYYNLGATYHRLGKINSRQADFDQAEALYNQCLDRDLKHEHADCYRGLAVLLAEQGREQKAEKLLQGWASLNPTSSAPRVELARLKRETGDADAEKQLLLEALAINPRDSRALAALGKVHEEDGNSAQALANYQRSLASNPFQRDLVARVAQLRAPALGVAPANPAGTRTVTAPPGQGRY